MRSRKWIGIAIALTMACSFLGFGRDESPSPTETSFVEDIPYCAADSSVLCVISFGEDNRGNGVVNVYNPAPLKNNLYLMLARMEDKDAYRCKPVKNVPRYFLCVGKPIPLRETIEVEAYSGDDKLIGRGDFVVSFLAIATPVIVLATEEGTATEALVVTITHTLTDTPTLLPNQTPATAAWTATANQTALATDTRTPTTDPLDGGLDPPTEED
jgi:hypothetical protein